MGNKVKTFHANMLKRYYERETSQVSCVEDKGILSIVSVAVMDGDDSMESGDGVMDVQMECPLGRGKEKFPFFLVSEVGFEPTPIYMDQNLTHFYVILC
ncbi:hypothetical protein DPMN_155041 [Dreissena polymorpha]|uniref:Uncharacterized protein n=1 Tax=Dreissena polymorpha TaxID=45954 RepID=A0A9D4FT09_DREPO|nr:hypothetical protein DPMN_155041 [Dreissena polymorpha]